MRKSRKEAKEMLETTEKMSSELNNEIKREEIVKIETGLNRIEQVINI